MARGKRCYRNPSPLKRFRTELRDNALKNLSVAVEALSQGFLPRGPLDSERLLEAVVFNDSRGGFKVAFPWRKNPRQVLTTSASEILGQPGTSHVKRCHGLVFHESTCRVQD